ncbi:hypothetical protein KIN20_019184 [Parelaphostrongylus tenuis]|uniref:Phospholipid/glycerol acyltransferase domain-containing protein n=1 Tax=Parelaphostrongylus tenuis TaxID=148309 RepID=A0AAD5MKP4_PARTN|nr:hypothetical protein KIN20_019184 [Parelaphostrongylus tenuis]
MIFEILAMYASILLGSILSTTCLILLGRSWGALPQYYLRTVAWIQEFYPDVYPKSDEPWPAIIKRNTKNALTRTKSRSSAYFSFLTTPRNHLDIAIDAAQSGIEAIVQDSLSTSFEAAPCYGQTLLRSSALPCWSNSQKLIFYVTLAFRWGFLFPIRLGLLLTSFAFAVVAALASHSKNLSNEEKVWFGIVYSRLYLSGMGMIVTYNNTHLRPKRAGVAVSNHMTINDVHALYAGTPFGAPHGFIITGQKHSGIIGSIEAAADRVCSTIWMDRKCANGRRKFLEEIMKECKQTGGMPILLFPEGYCTNNTQVLQFRRAIFKEGITIYPIAIKQDSRFGDSFWGDEKFCMHLLRVMSSWAVFYNVTYLAPMTHSSHETDDEFAARVQVRISDTVGVPAGKFDGYMWYNKLEQRRLLELQKEMCAAALTSHKWLESSESDDGYQSISDVLPLDVTVQ